MCAGIAVATWLAGHQENANAGVSPLQALSQAATPEVPAVAARLVAQAPKETRESTAIGVVRSANAIVQPASLPYVVGAISQSSPEMAAVVVAEAATLRPELAARLAQAALDAAPLARPANDVVLTPVQMATVERLAQKGVNRAEAKVLVQLSLPTVPVAAAAAPAVTPVAVAATAPAVVPAVAPAASPVVTVDPGVQVAVVKPVVQAPAGQGAGAPTATASTTAQQGPRTGPPVPPPAGTPPTPVTVPGSSVPSPGPQKTYPEL